MSEPPKKPPSDEPPETPPAPTGGYSATARSRYRRASAAGAVDSTPFRFGPPPDEPPTIAPAPPREKTGPIAVANAEARYRSVAPTGPADEPAATHGPPSARYRAATATQPVPDAIPQVIVDAGSERARREDSQTYGRPARSTTRSPVDPAAATRPARDTMPDPGIPVAEFVSAPIEPTPGAVVAVPVSIAAEPLPSTVDVVVDEPITVEPAPEPVTVADAATATATAPAVLDAVPPDYLGPRRIVDVTTYHLEMFHRPTAKLPPPSPGIAVVHAAPPGVRFYRYLYDAVGAPWHWYDRRRMTPGQLAAIVDDPRVEVHVLTDRGVPAGYAELDRRVDGEVELAYFGLFPEAIGRGLGSWFLRWAIHEAWRPLDVARVWVHTCTLDHTAALPLYLATGFVQFGEERHRQTIAAR